MKALFHSILKLTGILIFTGLLHACQKENANSCQMCQLSQIAAETCFLESLNRYVTQFNFEPASEEINQKQLESLATWLSNQRCIFTAEVLCNSCVYTDPPISEIFLISNGPGNDSLIVDVQMTSPLSISGVHYN